MSNFKSMMVRTLRPYQPSLRKVTPEIQKHILSFTLEYLKTEKVDEILMDETIESTDSQTFFMEAFAAYYEIFTQFWRIQSGLVKAPEVIEVLKESKLDEACHEEFLKILFGGRTALVPLIPRRNSLEKVSWRINISNGTSDLKQATVLIRMQMRDEEIKTFVLPIATFHLLRHNVASMLRGMQTLEGRSSMKKI